MGCRIPPPGAKGGSSPCSPGQTARLRVAAVPRQGAPLPRPTGRGAGEVFREEHHDGEEHYDARRQGQERR